MKYDDLSKLQDEVGEWAEKNFGDRMRILESIEDRSLKAAPDPGADVGALFCVLGANEEVGELSHSVLKRAQGIREDDSDVGMRAEMDAVGDVIVYLADFCHRRGYDLGECVELAWDGEVAGRDWDSKTGSSMGENSE